MVQQRMYQDRYVKLWFCDRYVRIDINLDCSAKDKLGQIYYYVVLKLYASVIDVKGIDINLDCLTIDIIVQIDDSIIDVI